MNKNDSIADRGFEYRKNCIAAKNDEKFRKIKKLNEIDSKIKTHGKRLIEETPEFK